MSDRDFSDSTKLEIVKQNLEKNNGSILCELCSKKIISISECHFDHIHPYAKGGKSVVSNCQILCADCNLRKNDKLLKDFAFEEKARMFLSGMSVEEQEEKDFSEEIFVCDNDISKGMTKDKFDKLIGDFIKKKGNIHKVDFGREYNNLPSVHYVKVYYGDLNTLKKAFGVVDNSLNWNRETIKNALQEYVKLYGDIKQIEMKKSNGLPSVPCILFHYPELKNFTDIKRELCGLYVQPKWTKELAIEKGKEFVKKNGKIRLNDLKAENGLPANNTIERLFGTLQNYQKEVGTTVTHKNYYVSKEEVKKALDLFFNGKDRVIESKKVFFEDFVYSDNVIYRRYNSFTDFCKEEGITVINSKKAKYSKREVDDAISNWIKNGNDIPIGKDLVKLGLPSMSVILKFYENWKEPFYIYKKLHEEMKRV